MTPDEKVKHFFGKFSEEKIKKGKILIQPQEELTHTYYIVEGKIRMYSMTKTGEEITLNLFREGSFIPLMVYLSGKENKYYFQAITSVQVVKAQTKEVLQFLKSDPEVLLDLASRFSMAIIGLLERIEGIAFTDAKSRIILLLRYLSLKFGEQTNEGIEITIPLRHEDIANWLGLTRETVSRQIKILKEQKVIRTEKQKILIFGRIFLTN